MQEMTFPTEPTATVAGSNGTWNSGLTPVRPQDGFNMAISATLAAAGTLSAQRFIDTAGNAPLDTTPKQVTLAANTPNVVSFDDGLPCQKVQVIVTNTSGAVADLSNVIGLQG